MRIAFLGSPEFAVPSLREVAKEHEVVLAVAQPDKPAGRGMKLTAPAVKLAAEELGVKVLQPKSARNGELEAALKEAAVDVGVVVAYGKILPQAVLDAPRLGCLNVHGSLLPKYRGAAPIQWSIIKGERETGITIMQLDAGMDTGPMLVERALAIGDEDTTGSLAPRLAVLGAEMMRDVLRQIAAGQAPPPRAQDNALASMAPMLDKTTGVIDWTKTAREISCLIRGVDPWPGASTVLEGEVIKVWSPRLVEGRGEPGIVLAHDRSGVIVACGEGALSIGELQQAGRKRMSAEAMRAGRAVPRGTRLGS